MERDEREGLTAWTWNVRCNVWLHLLEKTTPGTVSGSSTTSIECYSQLSSKVPGGSGWGFLKPTLSTGQCKLKGNFIKLHLHIKFIIRQCVYYFISHIFNTSYLLCSVSSCCKSVTIQYQIHVSINFSDHNYLGYYLVQLGPWLMNHVWIILYKYNRMSHIRNCLCYKGNNLLSKVKAARSNAWNHLQEYTTNNTYNNYGFYCTLFYIWLDKCIARLG